MTINHRAYRDNPSKWLGTCVEGPHRPLFTSWGKILLRITLGVVLFSGAMKLSLYLF